MTQSSRFAPGARAALHAVGQAVIITDLEGRISFWNRAAEALYGWTSDEVVGRPVMEVTPAVHVLGEARDIMERLLEGGSWVGEMVLRRRDGSTFLARVVDSPIKDADGALAGVVGVSEDITERRAAEEQRGASEQRLRLALAAGRLGVWEWDGTTGRVRWDASMAALFGIGEGSFDGTLEAWAAMLLPEDRHVVLEDVRRAVEAGREVGVQYRVRRPDGAVRWLEGTGRPLREDGGVDGFIGVTADVTERYRAEDERARLLAQESAARAAAEVANERLAFLSEATGALSAAIDHRQRLSRLAEAGVPRFADCCAVHVVEDDGDVRAVAVHHADAARAGDVRALLAGWPSDRDAPSGPAAAIREGRTSWIPDLADELLRVDGHRGTSRLELLRSVDLRRGFSVPLRGRDATVGAITFLAAGTRRLDNVDVQLAEELAARAGVLVENAMLVAARERDHAEQAYRAALLRALLDANPDGILVVAPDGRVLSWNERFLELWGFAPALVQAGDDALLERARRQVVGPDAFVAEVRRRYAQPDAPSRDEVVLRDGRILDRHGAPLHTEDGRYLGWAWSFRDITTERKQQAQIARAGERFAAVARTLQQSLLPPRLPVPDGIDLAARYHPALEGIEVGGDFYDVFRAGDDWIVAIGDVCGKGPEAARITGLVRWGIRGGAMRTTDPTGILQDLNTLMLSEDDTEDDTRFATVCCLRLRSRGSGGLVADVACAGHPAPIVARADGSVEELAVAGMPVGLFEDPDIFSVRAEIAPGESLIAVTDGVLEARDGDGTLLDNAGVAEVVAAQRGATAAAIGAAIEARALEHQGGIARDDIAVLVLTAGTSGHGGENPQLPM